MSYQQKKILLVHGWGFSPEFWESMISFLDGLQIEILDLNFIHHAHHPVMVFKEQEAVLSDYIVVGHSLGFMYMLNHFPLEFHHYIAVNSFARFSKHTDFQGGVPLRILDRMSKGLSFKPLDVMTQFYEQCGSSFNLGTDMNVGQLQKGLEWLKQGDIRHLISTIQNKLMIIASTGDPVVSNPMTLDSFLNHPCVWMDDDTHILPMTQPQACATLIQKIALTQ